MLAQKIRDLKLVIDEWQYIGSQGGYVETDSQKLTVLDYWKSKIGNVIYLKADSLELHHKSCNWTVLHFLGLLGLTKWTNYKPALGGLGLKPEALFIFLNHEMYLAFFIYQEKNQKGKLSWHKLASFRKHKLLFCQNPVLFEFLMKSDEGVGIFSTSQVQCNSVLYNT